MKISEIIESLNKLKEEYGDIKVGIYNDEGSIDEVMECKFDSTEYCDGTSDSFITLY